MKIFEEKQDTLQPTYIWSNGCKMVETETLAWEIKEIYATTRGYQYLQINGESSYFGEDDITFRYYRLEKRFVVNNISFYIESLTKATNLVHSFLKINDISLDEKIYITPDIKKRNLRYPKLKRIIDDDD